MTTLISLSHRAHRIVLACGLAATFGAGPALAQGSAVNTGALRLTAGVDFPSIYYFRGIRQEVEPKLTLWPYGDVGITLAKRVGVNFGVWNSLHTGSSGSKVPGKGMHYEERFYSSLTLGLSGTTVSGKYVAYTSPNLSYATSKEMDVQVTGTHKYAPYALVAFELSDKGQADTGAKKGTY